MNYKFGYPIPLNLDIFKTNFDYYNGMGKLSKDECIDRSLLVSGVQVVDYEDFERYVDENQLQDIFTR